MAKISNKGVALISMLLISMILVVFVISVLTKIKIYTGSVQIQKDFSLASRHEFNNIEKLTFLLSDRFPEDITNFEKETLGFEQQEWFSNNYWITLDRNSVVKFVDMSSLIGLNPYNFDKMQILLKGLKVPDERITRITDCIADWIDSDDLASLNGAEKAYYQLNSIKNAPRNAPMQSVSELKNVCGVTSDLYTLIRPYLTVIDSPHLNLLDASDTIWSGAFSSSIVEELKALRKSGKLTKQRFKELTQINETEYINLSKSKRLMIIIKTNVNLAEKYSVVVIEHKASNYSPIQIYQNEMSYVE